jgi:hypothetical protein
MKLVPGYPFVRGVIEKGPEVRPGMPPSPGGQPLEPYLNPTELGNPLDFPVPGDGNFDGNKDTEIQRINLTATMGLDSGDGRLNQKSIDMTEANGCYDESSKGMIAYGNPNTGRITS